MSERDRIRAENGDGRLLRIVTLILINVGDPTNGRRAQDGSDVAGPGLGGHRCHICG